LGLCKITFYVEDKKFIISAVDDCDNKKLIIIEKIEEIMKMQNIYKNYDQMIGDLVYKNNLLVFSEKSPVDLDYISLKEDNFTMFTV